MLEELNALDAKMRELAAHVRQLREENQGLRRQLAESQAELATLNERVTAATRRLDTLIEELPGGLVRGNGHN
jgi:chromosome segregation ATPase